MIVFSVNSINKSVLWIPLSKKHSYVQKISNSSSNEVTNSHESANMAAGFRNKLPIFYWIVAYIVYYSQTKSRQIVSNEYLEISPGIILPEDQDIACNLDFTLFNVAKFKFNVYSSRHKIRRCCTKWNKHGLLLLQTPDVDFPKDLIICIDVESNPGDTISVNKPTERIGNQSRPFQVLNPPYANDQGQVFTAQQLRSMKPHASIISLELKICLKGHGILQSKRGARAGKKTRERQNAWTIRSIHARITSRIAGNRNSVNRTSDISLLRKIPYWKTYRIPVVLTTNIRSIAKKVDELQQVAVLNNADAICVTETWLTAQIPDSCRYSWLQLIQKGLFLHQEVAFAFF